MKHNHQHCIDQALQAAKTICNENSARLTPLRLQVLNLIWQSHKPLGAYTLMEMMAEKTQRRIAPPTVYRALEFLLEMRLIHRINSLNAYIGCSSPQDHDQSQGANNIHHFFICRDCHNTREIIDMTLIQKIQKTGLSLKFYPEQQWLEVYGQCEDCFS